MIDITNHNDLVQFFNKFKSPVRATMITKTPVKMNKKDVATKSIENPFSIVYKLQTVVVELNGDYEQKVNDQRLLEDKDQDFKAQKNWFTNVNNTIVQKDQQLYFKVIEVEKQSATYQLCNGAQVPYEDFAKFVPNRSPSPKQDLDDEIKVRTYKIENVIGCNIDGKVRFINA